MLTLALASIFAAVTQAIDTSDFPKEHIVYKDVAIVGGGAAGTYAALRLREDWDASVLIIEIAEKLGGHVSTYYEETTHAPINYGVQAMLDYGPARAFFKKLNVETKPTLDAPTTTVFLDYLTAKNLSSYTDPAFTDVIKSLGVFLNETRKYKDMLVPGYWNLPSGEDFPPDLLLPFGEFAAKYGIEDIFPLMHIIAGVGAGGIRHIPTLEVIGFAFGSVPAGAILEGKSFQPQSNDLSEAYNKALDILKSDVLLKTCILEAERTDEGVKVVVQPHEGGPKTLIIARHLLVTPAPSLKNLAAFDLNDEEISIFGSSKPRPLYVGLVKTHDIPENYTISYISPDAAPANYLDVHNAPYTLTFQSMGPPGLQLFRVLLESNSTLDIDAAKTLVEENYLRLVAAGTLEHVLPQGSYSEKGTGLEFKEFRSHETILWRRSAEELKAGFVSRLYALQGKRSTWYTGSLWCQDFSAPVWAFTDSVIERMGYAKTQRYNVIARLFR